MKIGMLPAILACCLCGCVDVGVESREDMVSDKNHLEPVSVRVDDFAGVCARLVRTDDHRGLFSLVCTGRYQVVRRRIVDIERTGRHALSVGFVPGIYWGSEAVDGTDYGEWPRFAFKALCLNCVTVCVPTLLSLFYEPFDRYHDEKCTWWQDAAGYGLMGCCKRSQWKPWVKKSTESSLETVSSPTYRLSDYTVFVSGNPYRCAAGEESVSVTIPVGERTVNAQIGSVPSLQGELGRYVSSMKGVELEVEVEAKGAADR